MSDSRERPATIGRRWTISILLLALIAQLLDVVTGMLTLVQLLGWSGS